MDKRIYGYLIASATAALTLALAAGSVQAGGPGADVECTKFVDGSSSGDNFDIGETVTFDFICAVNSFAVSGTTPVTADLEMEDTFHADFDFIAGDVDCDAGPDTSTLTTPQTPVVAGQEVNCTFSVDPAGPNDTFRLRVVGSFDDCIATTNTGTADYDTDSDSDSVGFTINCPEADLVVTKTASTSLSSSGATVARGGTITYGIEVCNAAGADADAVDVILTDQLPTGTTVTTGSSPSFSTANGSVVTANVGTLEPGECAGLTLNLLVGNDVPCGTNLTNSASAASDSPEADSGDNSDSTTTSVVNCPTTPAASPTPSPSPTNPGGGGSGGGRGPSVSTGDSGTSPSQGVSAGQIALVALVGALTASGAAAAARRLR
jgi:uncharacterized repeat protein (TIGR01451 family)